MADLGASEEEEAGTVETTNSAINSLARIYKDTDGNKGLLAEATFGLDAYTAGGDAGRVYIGTGTENIALAKKSELDAVAAIPDVLTSIDIVGNELKYTDELGNVTVKDLSLYLDDTNLSRLVGGTLDGATGIVTCRREDDSTFDLDLSALLDDTRVTVNDTLTSTSTTEAASANTVKQLNDKIEALTTITEW